MITLDQLVPGMKYIFTAAALNTFGVSGSTSSPPQVAGKITCSACGLFFRGTTH